FYDPLGLSELIVLCVISIIGGTRLLHQKGKDVRLSSFALAFWAISPLMWTFTNLFISPFNAIIETHFLDSARIGNIVELAINTILIVWSSILFVILSLS